MNFVPQRNGSSSLVALTEDLAGVAGRNGSAPAFLYPPRHVTGALLTSMGFEFIRPDQVAVKWRSIHSPKIAQS